jgi:hypothetical protein
MMKDISKIDPDNLLSDWMWKVSNMQSVIVVSEIGDLFLLGKDDSVYWLQTGTGELSKVAEDLKQFEELLSDGCKVDEWFLPMLIEQLVMSGKVLTKDQVYSFIQPPILGGEYSVDNFEPTDMSVHFSFMGQICKQVKDLPDGTLITNIKITR